MPEAHVPWNKGRAQGQKRVLTVAQVRRVKELLQERHRIRDLALFSVALDTLLRASDLLALRVADVQDAPAPSSASSPSSKERLAVNRPAPDTLIGAEK